MIRRTIAACLALLACAAMAQAPEGAKYPSRPIKLIVGYTPGGSNDVVARLIARRMQESLGQPVVVENRPSNGAIVGAVVTAKAPADGYTLMIGATGPIAINPAIHQNLPYSPQRDFAPISLVATFPLIVSVKADSKIASVADLVKYTKANPAQSNYSSSSPAFQLATELLKESTGIVAEHVPYKGSNDSMQAVASGTTTFSMLDPGPAAGAIKGGLLRGVAVTSEKRSPVYPNVPTLKEQGVDLNIQFWIGLFAPAGTPAHIVKLLEQETAKAVAHPETVKSMSQLGLEPASSTSEALGRQVAREIETWTTLARKNNIKAD
jgi:tripartite-type tricarboxylate transporter receptor subunit TctC